MPARPCREIISDLPQAVLERIAGSFTLGSPEPSRLASQNRQLRAALAQRSDADALVHRVLPQTRDLTRLEHDLPAALQAVQKLPQAMQPDIVEELVRHLQLHLLDFNALPALLDQLLSKVLAMPEPAQRLRTVIELVDRFTKPGFMRAARAAPATPTNSCDALFDRLHAFADTLSSEQAAALAPHLAKTLFMTRDGDTRSRRWNALFARRDAVPEHRLPLLDALAGMVAGLTSQHDAKQAAIAMLELYPTAEPALRSSISCIYIGLAARMADPFVQLQLLQNGYSMARQLPSPHASRVYRMALANLSRFAPQNRRPIFRKIAERSSELEPQQTVECVQAMARTVAHLPEGLHREEGVNSVCEQLVTTPIETRRKAIMYLVELVEREQPGALRDHFFPALCRHVGVLADAERVGPTRRLIALLDQFPTVQAQRAALDGVTGLITMAPPSEKATHLLELNRMVERFHSSADRQMILSWSLVTTAKLPEGERPALLMPLLETACRLAESTPLGPAFSLLQNSVQNLSPAAAAALTQAMQVQCTTLAQSLHRGIVSGGDEGVQLSRFNALNGMAEVVSGPLAHFVMQQIAGMVDAAIAAGRSYAGEMFALCHEQLPEPVRIALATRLLHAGE